MRRDHFPDGRPARGQRREQPKRAARLSLPDRRARAAPLAGLLRKRLPHGPQLFRRAARCPNSERAGHVIPREIREHLDREPFDNWNWLSAFERASLVGLADDSSGDWVPWVARFPEYVLESEEGVAGIYRCRRLEQPGELPEGGPERRPFRGRPRACATRARNPGAPRRRCDDGENVCLERPNVAFFITHALRELQAFMDSLQLRIEQIVGAAGRLAFPGSRRTPAPGDQ